MNFMNTIIDAVPVVSVVTKIEVLSFNAPDEHYQMLSSFMNDCSMLDLTSEIIDETISIRKNTKSNYQMPSLLLQPLSMI